MGLCGSNDRTTRRPVIAPTIDHSDISTTVRLENIQKYYHFNRVLGHGHFGTVREVHQIDDPTKKLYAVKSIPKDKIVRELKLLRRELEMLRVVDHPNIIKFYETFEDERYVHIVMEECSGGDLFDHLIVNGQYTEREAAALLEKIIAAINHLHTLHICHRDIKPENFLFATLDKGSDIKIIDFGLATKFGEDQMHTVVGTPYYVAPEVLRGSYGQECDVWSLGVLLYVILGGYPPFFGESQHEIFRKITHGVYDYDREEWNDVSKEARDLIDSMLVVNPQRRVTLDQVLKHRWFSLNHDPSSRPQVPLRILGKLKNYRAPRRFKQEALKVVVKFLTNEQIDELRQAFEAIDVQCTGFLTAEEIQSAMQRAGLTLANEEISKIVNKVDYLNLGRLNYTEFVLATLDRKQVMTDEILFNAFKYFDKENTGYITAENLALAFKHAGYQIDPIEVAEMIKEFDIKKESRIDFAEFRVMLTKDDTPWSPEKGRRASHVEEEP